VNKPKNANSAPQRAKIMQVVFTTYNCLLLNKNKKCWPGVNKPKINAPLLNDSGKASKMKK
jgi:hypothetical protein